MNETKCETALNNGQSWVNQFDIFINKVIKNGDVSSLTNLI